MVWSIGNCERPSGYNQLKWPLILAIPAMSLKCKRVFFCCSKQTALESSNVSGETLWRQECLKNWQNGGAIEIAGAFKAVLLDL